MGQTQTIFSVFLNARKKEDGSIFRCLKTKTSPYIPMKNIFLLGAGFSNDISDSQFPLTKDIYGKISDTMNDELKEKYGFGKDDLEICLTRLDIDLYNNFTILLKEARDKISYAIAKLFSMKDKGIKQNEVANIFINKALKENDAVLTTNYDTYLENLLG